MILERNLTNLKKMNREIMFRDLNDQEEADFRKWARDNYEAFTEISTLWHPIVVDECEKINNEQSKKPIG